MSKHGMSRRTFIFGSAILAAGCATARPKIRKVSANEKLNIAGVGVGGKGQSDVDGAYDKGNNNIVALCDVDLRQGKKSFEKFDGQTTEGETARNTRARGMPDPRRSKRWPRSSDIWEKIAATEFRLCVADHCRQSVVRQAPTIGVATIA